MTNYGRAHLPGARYFRTAYLARRDPTLLTERIDDLRDTERYVRGRHPYATDAIVVLPGHWHALWTLPDGLATAALPRANVASGSAGMGNI